MIPMPLLMLWVNLTGQPLVIYIAPQETPVYSVPAPAQQEAAGCRYTVCKA